MNKRPQLNYMALGEIPKWVKDNLGVTITRHTPYNWIKTGKLPLSARRKTECECIKLKVVKLAGKYVTTAGWLRDFFAKTR